MTPAGYLAPDAAAQALGLSRDTFDRHLVELKRRGLVERPRIGRRRFFLASSVAALNDPRRLGRRLARIA